MIERQIVEFNDQLHNRLLDICSVLFDNTEIKTFSFMKLYNSGKKLYLCSNKSWMVHAITNKLYDDVLQYKYVIQSEPEGLQQKLWNSLNKSPLFDALYHFDIWNGVTFYQNYDNSFEVYGFSSSRENETIIDFYANQSSYIKQFIYHFREKLRRILNLESRRNFTLLDTKQMHNLQIMRKKDDIIVPKVTNLQNSIYAKRYYTGLGEEYLTSQQYNCLRLLAEGKTSKEIAKELALSYRSIEHYLEHIKVKLNLQYKPDLIRFFRSSYGE